MEEIWEDLIELDSKYSISNYGKIKSFYNSTGSKGINHILKPNKNSYGYLKVDLTKNKKSKTYYIHQLVAKTFLRESYFEGAQINHKDGNKENNTIDNLEWCTQSQNIKHAYDTGLMTVKKLNNKIKLSRSIAEAIRNEYKSNNISIRYLSSKYNVSNNCIYKIVKCITWKG